MVRLNTVNREFFYELLMTFTFIKDFVYLNKPMIVSTVLPVRANVLKKILVQSKLSI